MFLYGHVHGYERYFNMKGYVIEEINEKASFIIGTGGNKYHFERHDPYEI